MSKNNRSSTQTPTCCSCLQRPVENRNKNNPQRLFQISAAAPVSALTLRPSLAWQLTLSGVSKAISFSSFPLLQPHTHTHILHWISTAPPQSSEGRVDEGQGDGEAGVRKRRLCSCLDGAAELRHALVALIYSRGHEEDKPVTRRHRQRSNQTCVHVCSWLG